MNMRESFVQTTKELIHKDDRIALILAGISVAGFSEEIEKFHDRVFDAGISEQANISIAAGMSAVGMIPIFHSFAPFVTERAYEQLKIGFGYQRLRGNFVTTGASLDCSSFGATHQCPADIPILKQIPNMQIIVPGTAEEYKSLFLQTYDNDMPTYFRTAREQNANSYDVKAGMANVVKKGNKLTIVAVGNALERVIKAVSDLDVTILYYTTIEPFDYDTLANNLISGKLLICEPYYEGALLYDVIIHLKRQLFIDMVGIPHEFCKHYGLTPECYEYMGYTESNIREKAIRMINS